MFNQTKYVLLFFFPQSDSDKYKNWASMKIQNGQTINNCAHSNLIIEAQIIVKSTEIFVKQQ